MNTRSKTPALGLLVFALIAPTLMTSACAHTGGHTRDDSFFPSVRLAGDLIPTYRHIGGESEKFDVVEDVQPSAFKVGDLKPISFLKEGEIYARGEVMRTRAMSLRANLGLVDAKYIMDHQAELSPRLRGMNLIFTGTRLRDPLGHLFLPFLYWDWSAHRWYLDFGWVDGYVREDYLLRVK